MPSVLRRRFAVGTAASVRQDLSIQRVRSWKWLGVYVYLPGRRPFVGVFAGGASCVVLAEAVVPDSAEEGEEISEST